jgi:hypothetical protein
MLRVLIQVPSIHISLPSGHLRPGESSLSKFLVPISQWLVDIYAHGESSSKFLVPISQWLVNIYARGKLSSTVSS